MINESEKEKLIVGFKQAKRAIASDKAVKVFLAEDSESKIKSSLEAAASEKNVQIFYVNTMKELGTMCDIDVSASCAAVIK